MFFDEVVVNGLKQHILFSFVLDEPRVLEFFATLTQNKIKKMNLY